MGMNVGKNAWVLPLQPTMTWYFHHSLHMALQGNVTRPMARGRSVHRTTQCSYKQELRVTAPFLSGCSTVHTKDNILFEAKCKKLMRPSYFHQIWWSWNLCLRTMTMGHRTSCCFVTMSLEMNNLSKRWDNYTWPWFLQRENICFFNEMTVH